MQTNKAAKPANTGGGKVSSLSDCSIPGWVENNRPCGECKHFFLGAGDVLMGGCKKKLMAVLKNKPVLSPEGDCCFEE